MERCPTDENHFKILNNQYQYKSSIGILVQIKIVKKLENFEFWQVMLKLCLRNTEVHYLISSILYMFVFFYNKNFLKIIFS